MFPPVCLRNPLIDTHLFAGDAYHFSLDAFLFSLDAFLFVVNRHLSALADKRESKELFA